AGRTDLRDGTLTERRPRRRGPGDHAEGLRAYPGDPGRSHEGRPLRCLPGDSPAADVIGNPPGGPFVRRRGAERRNWGGRSPAREWREVELRIREPVSLVEVVRP